MKTMMVTLAAAAMVCGMAFNASAENFWEKIRDELQKAGAAAQQMDPAKYAELQKQREEARREFQEKIRQAVKEYWEGFHERHKVYAMLLREYFETKIRAFFNKAKEELVARIKDRIEDIKDEIEKKKQEHDVKVASMTKEFEQSDKAMAEQLSMAK